MKTIYNSIDVVEKAIEQRLSLISDSMTIYEISDTAAFIKEAKQLRDTLISLGYCDEEKPEAFDYDNYSDVSGEDFVNAYVQACSLLVTLYSLLDDAKIKETKSEWVFEDMRDFFDMSKIAFGNRIPDLPLMRVVSKKPSSKKTKAK